LRSRLGIRIALLMAAFGAASCGGDSPMAPPPPTDAPRLVCPQPIIAQSPDGESLAVTYPDATVVGGQPPMTKLCEPRSAEIFPIGETIVTCRVSDLQSRTDACTFTVTVELPPRVAVTRYVAFGDSISDGVLGFAPFAVGDPGPAVGYAFKLKTLLEQRYTAQTITMTDEGVGGDDMAKGLARLPGVLSRDNPEVVMLFVGINNLNGARDAAIPGIIDGLRSMVRTTRGRGMTPLVATFLPQRRGAQRAFAVDSIVPANERVRAMVAAEGAGLVDLYQAFDGNIDTLIGPDGLHPTEAGYQKIAETFFAMIRSRFEAVPVSTSLR
jgi:lysophospholipase L1-like esterase